MMLTTSMKEKEVGIVKRILTGVGVGHGADAGQE